MSANNQSAQGGDNHINLYEPHVWKHHTKVEYKVLDISRSL